MPRLDKEARMVVEQNVDSIIKYPKRTEEAFRKSLISQGIQPNLETVLSMITGFIEGLVESNYIVRHGRHLEDDERNDLNELLNRRAFEIRQALISTRIEE